MTKRKRRRIVRAQEVGPEPSYRKGGKHPVRWAIVLDCGHAQHEARPEGKEPKAGVTCRICDYPETAHWWRADSEAILAKLARQDAELAGELAKMIASGEVKDPDPHRSVLTPSTCRPLPPFPKAEP